MTTRSGVLFDVDGTLLDTNFLHTVAWSRALRAGGYEGIEMVEVLQAIGIASEGLVEHLTGKVDDTVVKAHSTEYDRFTDDIVAFPKAADLIRACRRLGHTVVLATSGAKGDLDWMLPAIGVGEDEIDGAITSDDVEASKPSPDLLQVSMRDYDLDPQHTVVVGDTVWDVLAGHRAGIRCIALECGGINEAQLRDAGAHEVYANPTALLEQLTDSLIGQIAG